ncbi:hypothetical protein IV203_015137 [Nitzschia inconspicua]|uniref:Uncharacterized protein n=1 Tax=Nitzschia inconspicua TaxID=303405 RepID=A0A9K3LBN2_9STRA|nr:hypothetical protein IV203_015137 [Nitzschia inconspicua]
MQRENSREDTFHKTAAPSSILLFGTSGSSSAGERILFSMQRQSNDRHLSSIMEMDLQKVGGGHTDDLHHLVDTSTISQSQQNICSSPHARAENERTVISSISNTNETPTPVHSLKPPPAASASPNALEVETVRSFADLTFDEEFIRQQEEILSNIQRQKEHYPPRSPQPRRALQAASTMERRFSKNICGSLFPPKDRADTGCNSRQYNCIHHRRSASYDTQDSGDGGSQHTETTATNSTKPSSLSSSIASLLSSGGARADMDYVDSQDLTTDQETDIAAFMDDTAVIQEQQRILEDILRKKQASQRNDSVSKLSLQGPRSTLPEHRAKFEAVESLSETLTTRHGISYSTSETTLPHHQQQLEMQRTHLQEHRRWQTRSPSTGIPQIRPATRQSETASRQQDAASKLEKRQSTQETAKSSMERSHQHHHMEDQTFQVGKKKLHVQGTRTAYDAIANGNAIIVQCATCKAILQVASSAKLLYCSFCENVTPVQLAQEQQVTDPRNGSDSIDLDERISRSIQNQEHDVACARKLAKVSR